MKTIFHYDAGPPLMARLAALAADGFEVMPCPEEDEEYFEALLPDAEVLLHVLKPVTAAVIERAAKLRLIQKIGVGVNTIDLSAARGCANGRRARTRSSASRGTSCPNSSLRRTSSRCICRWWRIPRG